VLTMVVLGLLAFVSVTGMTLLLSMSMSTSSSLIIHLTGILIGILSLDYIAGAVSLGSKGDPLTEVIAHRHTIREKGVGGYGDG
jgi:hypothetical protein